MLITNPIKLWKLIRGLNNTYTGTTGTFEAILNNILVNILNRSKRLPSSKTTTPAKRSCQFVFTSYLSTNDFPSVHTVYDTTDYP